MSNFTVNGTDFGSNFISRSDIYTSDDHRLFAWGYNAYGQLGLGNTTNISSPAQLTGDANWVKVGTGYSHTIAARSDGTLWSWGSNPLGELGLNNTTNYSSPMQINLNAGSVVKIAAGQRNSYVLNNNGTLYSWGRNNYGQLGIGNTNNRSTPATISGTWADISTWNAQANGIKSNGTMWVWGYTDYGSSGTGTMNGGVIGSTPVQVGTDTNWVSVSNGYAYVLAIKTDGTLWSWGWNNQGQLAKGFTSQSTTDWTPVQVGTLTNWSKVSAGQMHALAIKTDGTLWSWGWNSYGQLGQNNTTGYSSPVQIGSASNWANVFAGMGFSSAIKTDGTLWTWGEGTYGQLGQGNAVHRSSPVQVGSGTTWTLVTNNYGKQTLAINTY